MKIFKPTGSKERFSEIFQRVTKVKLNEGFMGDSASLNSENVINMAFEQLKSGELKVEQSNSQGSGEQSYVELVCKDKQGNDITFTFKVQSSAGDQDGVYNVNGVMLTNFTFDSPNEEVVELDENGLKKFNAQHGKELFDAIQQYITVEDEEPIDSLYEDAIRKIDSSPFGKDSFNKMQTGKAYVDEKPINPAIRVKAPELDKFIKEDANSLLHYSQAARDSGILFPNAKEMGVTNQYILVNALKEIGIEVKNIVTNGDKFELILSYNNKSFRAMLKKNYGSAFSAVKLIKNKLGIQESLYEEEVKMGDYPDQIGKKFKPKEHYPKKKRKPQTTVKLSENMDDDDEISDLNTPVSINKGAENLAHSDMSKDPTMRKFGSDKANEPESWNKQLLPYDTKFQFAEEKVDEPKTGDDNVTDTEFMNKERQGLQGGEENDVPEDTTNDVSPEEEMGTENDVEAGEEAPEGAQVEPDSDEMEQIAQDSDENNINNFDMKFNEFISSFQYTNDGIGRNTSINDVKKEQLLVGIAVEMEHTTDLNQSASIAIDHLTENDEYYSILIKSGLVNENKALELSNQFLNITVDDDTPDDSAQTNASADANSESDDKDMEDILLGFKPHNVGDEVPDTSKKSRTVEPEAEEEPEIEPEKKEDELGESVNKKINNLITEEQIKIAKLTLNKRNIPTGMSKKEAVEILMNNNLKKIL